MEKLNIGMIGCGLISNLHARGYRDNPRARLYAVCDVDRDLVAARKEEWGAEKTFTDYRELLADPELDAVEIITPHKLHEQMTIDALDAGKHVALQKPMTISLESADRMVARASESDRVFRVSDHYLFYPPIVLAKEMIDAGEIGEPGMVRMKMVNSPRGGWDMPVASYDWRVDEYSEGRFSETFDHGHHEWSTAWYLMGEIERVSAWIDSADGVIDNPVTLMWKYKDAKRYGICDFVYAEELYIPSKYYPNDEWFEITGSRGIIFVHRCTGDIHSGPAVSLFGSQGWVHYDEVRSDWVEGFKGALENFIDAITGVAEPLLTGEQGREILRMSFAIYNSAKKRREVYLEELDRSFPALYAWRRRRREKRESYIESFKSPRFGENFSRYAPQAKELTEGLLARFDAEAAAGWESVVGIRLASDGGVGEQTFALHVAGGEARLEEAPIPENAKFTITMPAGTWAAIVLGKKSLESALFRRQLKIEGETLDGMRLRSAFHI
jgi:predicted dehydrogenase/putative sterol carrier protein